jgi:membrane fusion protein, multidrug efflux system
MKDKNKEPGKKSRLKVYIPVFLVILLILAASVYWLRQYSRYIKTDDAYIDTENISVSSKLMGHIVQLYADEGDSVQKGKLLAELDSNDILAQKEHAIALKQQSEANLAQSRAQYMYNKENIKVLEVGYNKAKSDYERAKSQYDGGVIPEEQYDHIRIAFKTAGVQLEAAKKQLKVSEAQISTARAAVESANAQIAIIETQLKNTKLISPISGIIAKRWLLPGDLAQPGQSVFTVTNNHKLWVLVYLEETKIANVHLNQQSHFTIDAFPGVTFTGKVFSVGSNTASQFSLIPPNNASGNFTKITQRIPVKISIDGTNDKTPLSSYDILAGMSVVVKIMKDR